MTTKQTKISDFFKSYKKDGSVRTPSQSSTPIRAATSATKPIIDNNHKAIKRPLDDEDGEVYHEVNFIDLDLLACSFDEFAGELPSADAVTDTSSFTKAGTTSNYQYETFRSIIKSILSDGHYESLFDENDWNQIQGFTSLPGQVQLLYIKLYMRKRDWISVDHIKYPEISLNGNHLQEILTLVEHGFLLDSSCFESINEALEAISVPEMKSFVKSFQGFNMKKYRKSKLVEEFVSYIKTTRSVCSADSSSIEQFTLKRLRSFCDNKYFRINREKSKLFDRIFLLYCSPYFLLDQIENLKTNDDQCWHRVVLGDYAVFPKDYPQPRINKVAILFESREESIQMTRAFDMLCRVMIRLNQKQYDLVVTEMLADLNSTYLEFFLRYAEKDLALPVWLRQFTATGMLVSALNASITALEKVREYQVFVQICKDLLAQQIYGTIYRPHWYTRASLICKAHLKQPNVAEELCLQGLKDETVRYHHRLDLYSRLIQLKKAYSLCVEICPEYHELKYPQVTITADYRNIENDSARKNFFFQTDPATGDEEILSVEQVAIRHYRAKGYPQGIHCESSVYHALFALLFWDVLYSPDIPDAFRYHRQILPLDLYDKAFYQRRQNQIDERVLEIERFTETELESALLQSWTINCEKVSLVNWEGIERDVLMEIALCLTGAKLSKILSAMSRDYRHMRKGLPDLIVWNPSTKQIKLVEVKGPMDHISDIQSIWLTQFCRWDVPAELCNVKPQAK